MTLLPLALPAASGIAVHQQDPSRPLHILGPGSSVLFTLTATADRDAAAEWRETIRQSLSGLT